MDHHTKKIWIELAKDVDEYHVFARSEKNRFESYREGNIILHLIPAIGKRERSFLISGFLLLFYIPRFRITHLLSQSPINGGLAAVIASKLFGLPVMVEIHGDVFFKYFQKKTWTDRILSKLVRYSLRNATLVRSLSNEMSRLLDSEGIKNNVVVIPNRVDLKLFHPPKSDFRAGKSFKIISVGRFVPQKGYNIAIEAVLELSKKYPVELYLIGGGELFEELTLCAGDNSHIHLIEWMEQKELIRFLHASDLYIQPSIPFLGEAMPRTILEAMGMGLPVIATNIAAIPGVVDHGINGLLIEPGSREELANAIEKLLLDEKLRFYLGTNAFNKASSQYEWNNAFRIYRNALYGM
ncbi:MAG TPA: glycosyltransferase family 4 protein [Saprospiraceae bacterium]|nr:glycosyltransferase family 4 protein [Saprospiraceae bacterium]